jgi:hypothetical protein
MGRLGLASTAYDLYDKTYDEQKAERHTDRHILT